MVPATTSSLPRPALPWLGLALTGVWVLQAWLSWQSILPAWKTVLLSQSLTWAGFAWALHNPKWSPPAVLWGIAFRLAALGSLPLMEDDWARYLWDGWMVRDTGNPYGSTPLQAFGNPDLSPALQSVLSSINHPDLPTLYGPTLQAGFGLGAWIAPGQLWPLKGLLFLADAGVVLALHRWGPVRAALAYAWCPLAIHETCVQAHADVLAVLPLVLAWFARRSGRTSIAAGLLGIAIAGKVLALPAAPFLLGHRSARPWLVLVGTVFLAYAPFLFRGGADGSLLAFGAGWEFNSSLVGVLGLVLEPIPSRAMALLLVAPVIAWEYGQVQVQEGEPPRLDRVFGLVLFASAVVNPWYLLWVLPFVALHPTRTGWVACAAVGLSYATGMNLGIPGLAPYEHPAWVRPLEYGIVGVTLAHEILRERIRRRT